MLKILINFILSFFKIKIIRFFSHKNRILVIQRLDTKNFIKISFFGFSNSLLQNEYQGFNWYLNRFQNDKIFISFKKYTLFNVLNVNLIEGKKISYLDNFLKNKKYIIKLIDYYYKIWPRKRNTPSHGDLTLDNLIFDKNQIYLIDWENFNKKKDAWGFDLVYFFLSTIFLPNLKKKKLPKKELKEISKIWKKIKKLLKNTKIKNNPIKYFLDKFKKDLHWKRLSKKFPNKFFLNKVDPGLLRDVEKSLKNN